MALAQQELRRDRLFPLLTPEQQDYYLVAALAIGANAATPYHGESIPSLARKMAVKVEDCNGENVFMGSEIYAEYDAGDRRIRLHRTGAARLAARLARTLPGVVAQEQARDLLIAHELFHHLEATCLGPVHRSLPPISVPFAGRLWRVRRYVLRTREIAAHSFAHTLLGLGMEEHCLKDRIRRG